MVESWGRGDGTERWRALFADLDAQFEAEQVRDGAPEAADRARYESGQLSLVDRLRGAGDAAIRLGIRGADPVDGVVADVGANWVLMSGLTDVIVAVAAIRWADGLRAGRSAADPGWAAPDLRRVFRALTRERTGVAVTTIDAQRWHGTPAAVFADHVDLVLHAAGGRTELGPARSVPLVDVSTIVRT